MKRLDLRCRSLLVGCLVGLAACHLDSAPGSPGAVQEGDGGAIQEQHEPVFGVAPGIVPKVIITPRVQDAGGGSCGDGELGRGETCDPGIDGCCNADCSGALPAGAVCRAAEGECDIEESCDGSAFTCPADAVREAESECRAASGVCDAPERCDGESKHCPDDAMLDATTPCREAEDACDAVEYCSGADAECPPDVVSATTTVCRPPAEGHLCDAPEYCDGATKVCPEDLPWPADTICRTTQGRCDEYAVCDGESMECPPVMASLVPAGTVCREPEGPCDAPERCDGESPLCPEDRVASAETTCRPVLLGDDCDLPERCDGRTKACPLDVVRSADFVCRPVQAGAVCDVAERCTGSTDSKACPNDGFVRAGQICRPSGGQCDPAESCTGAQSTCPPDARDTTSVCRDSAGACDPAETCNGGLDCPADVRDTTSVCRPSRGECDPAERCNGGVACPADVRSTAVCRPSAGPCDPAESCNGGVACPADARSTAVCRPAAHPICDLAESCDGVNAACPADRFADNTVECRPIFAGDECDAPEYCSRGTCPPDLGWPDPPAGVPPHACNPPAVGFCSMDICCPGATRNRGNGCDLGPGVNMVFVTSTVHGGGELGLAGADAQCNQLAREANLAGTFHAWLSGSGNGPHARDRVSTVGAYARISDGGRIAENFNDLIDAALKLPLNSDEQGRTLDAQRITRAWTGTLPSGFLTGSACGAWANVEDGRMGTYGDFSRQDGTWTDAGTPAACSNRYHVYCIQDAVTAASR